MKKLIIIVILTVLILFVSCNTVDSETETIDEDLTVERWQIGENFFYTPSSIWGDIIYWLEIEREEWQIVKQCFSTYNLKSREKTRILEIPVTRMMGPFSVYEDHIVWASRDRNEDESNTNWDIFLFDINTGEMQQLTTSEYTQFYPKIYGDIIVWLDNRHEEEHLYPKRYDVYTYNLKTNLERRLTSTTSIDEDEELDISGNLVVWTDNRHADPDINIHASNEPDYNNEIYVYDLTTNQERRISTYPGNDHFPSISGNNIVWLRQLEYNRADVYAFNLETGQETQISNSGYAASPPIIDIDRVVWQDARSSLGNTDNDVIVNGRKPASDIYLYDLETRKELKLTSEDEEGNKLWAYPVIHGDYVIYYLDRMVGAIIYAIHLTFN